ncbi:hypothetical protein Agub_g5917, partial [Astrephomene gubernaculifera]
MLKWGAKSRARPKSYCAESRITKHPVRCQAAGVWNWTAPCRMRRSQRCPALATETVQETQLAVPQTDLSCIEQEGDREQAGPGPLSAFGVPDVSFVSLVKGKYTVFGRIRLRAPASAVYALLTDHGNCHRVFSNVASSEVVTAEEGGEKEVVQSCRWNFLAFSGTFRIRLGVTELPDCRTLSFKLIQSSFMRDFEGQWVVRQGGTSSSAAPAGAVVAAAADVSGRGGVEDEEEWCEVEHVLSVVPA